MKKLFVWGVLSCAALAVAAAGVLAFNGTVEDWNDGLIDEVTFVQEGPWGGQYEALEVGTLDNSKAAIEGNEKGTAAAKEVAQNQDSICQAALREGYTVTRPKPLAPGEAAPEGARVAVLTWECTEISPGSRAKRVWVSFGAGQSGVTLTGVLKDKASGHELLRFTHRRSSGANFVTGGNYVKMMTMDSSDTAKDVGAMLALVLSKPGKPADSPAAAAVPEAPKAEPPPPAGG